MTLRPGEPTGTVMLLTGPAAVGKSTVARQWACTRRRIAIAHDEIRRCLSNKADSAVGPVDAARREVWVQAIRHCADQSRRASEFGHDVIVDAYLTPDEGPLALGGWYAALGHNTRVVVLNAEFSFVRARNAARPVAHRMAECDLAINHRDAQTWLTTGHPVIDTGGDEVADTLAALERILAADSAAVAS